jgi:hypothetical protein
MMMGVIISRNLFFEPFRRRLRLADLRKDWPAICKGSHFGDDQQSTLRNEIASDCRKLQAASRKKHARESHSPSLDAPPDLALVAASLPAGNPPLSAADPAACQAPGTAARQKGALICNVAQI